MPAKFEILQIFQILVAVGAKRHTVTLYFTLWVGYGLQILKLNIFALRFWRYVILSWRNLRFRYFWAWQNRALFFNPRHVSDHHLV